MPQLPVPSLPPRVDKPSVGERCAVPRARRDGEEGDLAQHCEDRARDLVVLDCVLCNCARVPARLLRLYACDQHLGCGGDCEPARAKRDARVLREQLAVGGHGELRFVELPPAPLWAEALQLGWA
eukprot:CAMPEP_0206243824 /NCGR_PEP_ID=MMETSP0047_2-20121206/17814_1 /ASSEMBLY_ACC=CAM_ASM_000192 /TAXON_ID=195065 /ORGANISM="Chroomonas mesostigmatica_cf, Strain CCMP1168" /LENGTH=124 /DNA_ID=CAMNT_0053668971 /DNA_START=118 /DNA_END=492 /DNA_ORIENTATION=-